MKAFGWSMRIGGLLLFVSAGLTLGCEPAIELRDPFSEGAPFSLGALGAKAEEPLQERGTLLRRRALEQGAMQAEAAECRQKIVEAQEQPAFSGIPKLEARRARLLARAKAEPVVFLEEPKYQGEESVGTEARRRALTRSEFPRDAFKQTFATFRDFPERLRALFLRDGYFYTDDPRAARWLTTEISLEKLFREPRLVMMRGAERLEIRKGDGGVYFFDSGKEKGQRARLLLFDRVWIEGAEPGPPLHVDVRELSQREGIEGMRISHMGTDALVADIRFGGEWVPALLNREGPDLQLDCMLIEPEDSARIGRARDEAYRRALVLLSLRQAIASQVRLGLPFDEPKTETGQQDGKLRARWQHAYATGKKSYSFNGDKYDVYNSHGEPIAPQVCIDFVTESLERASGMHFAAQSKKPQKITGALDFDELLGGFRRQELALRNYARQNPSRLKLHDYAQSEWVKYEKVDKFFSFVEQEREQMRPGDIVIIRGRAAWDRYRDVHTHTFFIYESDPVTGVPTLLAGNSGKPRIVSWDSEMLRAPKRSIRHRIRPNMEWLYDHIVLRTPLRGERWSAPLSLAQR